MVLRVCIIGGGPSGMGALAMFNKMSDQGDPVEVTCFEKQDKTGGLWNLTWRTGIDEYGEPVHCSQYRDLFSNNPKEGYELPDYTFSDHFEKPIPSFPPRQVLEHYIRGYWRHQGIKDEDVLTRHCVRSVRYSYGDHIFTVKVINLKTRHVFEQEFDRLVVATGHFSVPHFPTFPGLDTFNGRVLHSHDFRNAREFRGQRVLCVGAAYSGEDIAMQCVKFGAAHVTISHRSRPLKFHWPEQITEVPLLVKADDKTCHFSDGSVEEIDAIIFCTGYELHYPFMPSELTLKSGNVFFPPNLYRGIQWHGATEGTKDAGGRLFYLGMQNQAYTFTMFMVQSLWMVHVIKGLYSPPDPEQCKLEIAKYVASEALLTDNPAIIDAQTAYVKRLGDDVGYPVDLDVSDIYKAWDRYRHEDILSYRNKSFVSKFTKERSPVHPLPWLKCFDDSFDGYLNALTAGASKDI